MRRNEFVFFHYYNISRLLDKQREGEDGDAGDYAPYEYLYAPMGVACMECRRGRRDTRRGSVIARTPVKGDNP